MDPRIICYETERPELEPLPAIPEELVDKKDIREWIIDSLSKEMAIFDRSRSTEIQPVSPTTNHPQTINVADQSQSWSIYDPELDGNCLFKSLSWGLFVLNKKLVGPSCMRDRLMECLCDNPDTIAGNQESITWKDIALLEDHHFPANSLHDYAEQIRQEGTWGGQLELLIFSTLFRVNVAVYESIGNGPIYQIKPEQSVIKSENRDTVHLVYAGQSHYQLLCQRGLHPSESHILQDTTRHALTVLTSLDTECMANVYKKISEELPDRNGYVTQFNIFLTALMGCNTNSALLGSREQSKSALFYIGEELFCSISFSQISPPSHFAAHALSKDHTSARTELSLGTASTFYFRQPSTKSTTQAPPMTQAARIEDFNIYSRGFSTSSTP